VLLSTNTQFNDSPIISHKNGEKLNFKEEKCKTGVGQSIKNQTQNGPWMPLRTGCRGKAYGE